MLWSKIRLSWWIILAGEKKCWHTLLHFPSFILEWKLFQSLLSSRILLPQFKQKMFVECFDPAVNLLWSMSLHYSIWELKAKPQKSRDFHLFGVSVFVSFFILLLFYLYFLLFGVLVFLLSCNLLLFLNDYLDVVRWTTT